MGLMDNPETSVLNHLTPRNNLEDEIINFSKMLKDYNKG
jgi:hypothetical protein